MLLTIAFMAACFVHPVGYDYGRASWYGHEWEQGKHRGTMANGHHFDHRKLTAASYDYPLGTVVEVMNQANGERVTATITDRGPARRLNRRIDLSQAAARKLGFERAGLADVAVFVRKYTEVQ